MKDTGLQSTEKLEKPVDKLDIGDYAAAGAIGGVAGAAGAAGVVFAAGVAGVAGASVVGFIPTFAAGVVFAAIGGIFSTAIHGKKVGIFTGAALISAYLGAGLVSYSISKGHQSEIDSLRQENSALVEKLDAPLTVTPKTLDSQDYLRMISSDGAINFYQKITNSSGKIEYAPVGQVLAEKHQEISKRAKETAKMQEMQLNEEYERTTNLLSQPNQ